MTFDESASDGKVEQDRILAELGAIFQTVEFERAPVMRRLLAFLVRTSLAGKGDELKAYSVAVDGLGRDPDFDSQSDSYPRVQVGRLRKMLDIYYATTPPQDDVRLLIKTGGYRVDFVVAPPQPASKPSIPRLSHGASDQSDSKIADDLDTDQIEAQSPIESISKSRLVGWPRIITPINVLILTILLIATLGWIIISRDSAQRAEELAVEQSKPPVLEIANVTAVGGPEADALAKRVQSILGVAMHRSWLMRVRTPNTIVGANLPAPDYRLIGQVNAGPDFKGGRRIMISLWDVKEGNQIWSNSAVMPDDQLAVNDIIRPFIIDLIRPFGVVATDQRNKHLNDEKSFGYACLLDYDSYFRDHDPALAAPVRRCVAETLKREPRNPVALAAASFLEYDWRFGRGTPASHARGSELARRAVMADPYSADAQLADAHAAFVLGQCRRGGEIADRAIDLNPYNPQMLGMLGYLYSQCDNAKSEQLLIAAHSVDTDLPPLYSIVLMLLFIDHGRPADAIAIAESIRAPSTGMSAHYELASMLSETASGDIETAKKHWQSIVNMRQVKDSNPNAVLSQYLFAPGIRAEFIAYLTKKGVLPPEQVQTK